ncbi:flagellar protein FliS [Gottschalkia purinilytica]|uniref:Flagellar secretion chaperone FliS n=1 Tax=Gottschalkia purinilytica TaxID=1503 RepID=A0A0L0WDT5_GOTPU|nr:flagellar export chaperone FliS [Gottschalkia purinilytica]KNF09638.1 flagellar protein FliS [Gottschalkia purinilytica]
MAISNPYQKYQQNSIVTASPEQLTLMLYDGAIKFMNMAKLYMEEKNIQETHNSIMRAQDIINELNITLNMNYGISKNLRSLYTYILEKLIDANLKKDYSILDEVISLVEDLRDTWKEAMQKNRIESVQENSQVRI